MMKKLFLLLVFFAFFGFLIFAQAGEQQEEIDFLLFLPNSSDKFVNEAEAKIQLDKLANYVRGRNLSSGQISVYGYAAAAVNDIEPMDLSRARALFVTSELQKRGVPKVLFSDPVGYGEVDLWGGNTNEEDRSPNRRVRILLDGNVLTPSTVAAVVPEIKTPSVVVAEKPIAKEESSSGFPWWLLLLFLLLLLLIPILFLLLKKKKSPDFKPEVKPDVKPMQETPAPRVVPAAAAPAIVPVAASVSIVNLEEEIRYYAYMLSLTRNDWEKNPEEDWFVAVAEICARYEADGCETYTEDGTWWARKSF